MEDWTSMMFATGTAAPQGPGVFWRPSAAAAPPLRVARKPVQDRRLAASLLAVICALSLMFGLAGPASAATTPNPETAVAAQTLPAAPHVGAETAASPVFVGVEGAAGYDGVLGCCVAPNGLPPLRQQYVDAVGGIDETVSAMRAAGSSAEDIARAAHAQRRAIGEQFKDLTPDPLRTQIFDRNVQRYGDPLGPSVDWLRDAGKSWDEIIESAARTGGQDLGF